MWNLKGKFLRAVYCFDITDNKKRKNSSNAAKFGVENEKDERGMLSSAALHSSQAISKIEVFEGFCSVVLDIWIFFI